ncbi:MAG: hypothetical protein JWR30_2716 [Conexibacter sp.]|nr:hypothetical protein [Solirubrobacterales bacterium]MCW3023394.1 hypothetical protein [Conexibacter sp.]MDX6713515.1 hypothetical protein [Baekduia sp.]MDX6731206.1 hypothetical protein [Baekduia sp.]
MLRRFTLLICLFALAAPIAAHAQDSPFAPLPPAQTAPDPVPTATSSSSSSDGGGLAGWQTTLIVVAGGILLLGIAWAIVADARSVAPTGDEPETKAESKARQEADLKRRKARNRAAAKRSRDARKKNRPRA